MSATNKSISKDRFVSELNKGSSDKLKIKVKLEDEDGKVIFKGEVQ